jgi:hypothetical protein
LLFFTNNFVLLLADGSENQYYLSFDMPLREHIEQRGLSIVRAQHVQYSRHGLQTRASQGVKNRLALARNNYL